MKRVEKEKNEVKFQKALVLSSCFKRHGGLECSSGVEGVSGKIPGIPKNK